MFSKKNKETARKVKVQDLTPDAQAVEIKVQVKPLVRIEQHQLTVNGKPKAPQYRLMVADRDVITLSQREYDEVFMEMLRHKDAGELIHDISEVHAEEHANEKPQFMLATKGAEEILKRVIGEEGFAKVMQTIKE